MALWIAASARRWAWADARSFSAIWISVEEIVRKLVPANNSTAVTNMTTTKAAPRGCLEIPKVNIARQCEGLGGDTGTRSLGFQRDCHPSDLAHLIERQLRENLHRGSLDGWAAQGGRPRRWFQFHIAVVKIRECH